MATTPCSPKVVARCGYERGRPIAVPQRSYPAYLAPELGLELVSSDSISPLDASEDPSVRKVAALALEAIAGN